MPCRAADAVLPAQFIRPHSGLVLLQDANDLLFAETAFPHRLSPRLENRLTSNRGLFRGARQKYCQKAGSQVLQTLCRCRQ